MAFWWVSQNKTFRHERAGGYLWAPKANEAGQTPHHWRSMLDVHPGDVVFSYVDQTIRAIGVAETGALESARPEEFSHQAPWKLDGYEVRLSYQDVDPPLKVPAIASKLAALLTDRYSPLTKNGTGVQGYLFSLSDRAGRFILAAIGHESDAGLVSGIGVEIAETAIRRSSLPSTEKSALVKSRIGQGRFRSELLRYWQGRCAVTGLEVIALLKASHIKPWSSSDNRERLDPFNGLLLASQYDAAFDAGLISFSDAGTLLVSEGIDLEELPLAGLDPTARLSRVDPAHAVYLAFHRENVAVGARA